MSKEKNAKVVAKVTTIDKIKKDMTGKKNGRTFLESAKAIGANENTVRKLIASFTKMGKRKCRVSGKMLESYCVAA